MENSESSSDDSIPMGFDVQELLRKRYEKLNIVRSVEKHEDSSDEDGLPLFLRYETLLKKAMDKLSRDQNETVQKRKLPLEIKREPGNKTSCNVVTLASMLNRDQDHLTKYILTELSAEGSINKEGKLLIKGRYLSSQIQDILRLYIEHFVVCKACDDTEDTVIIKENKLFFLRCRKCGSSRYVGNIKEGYKAKGKVKPKLRGLI
ncbi:Eukaryotic translation initiation factor 2 subunit beta [Astathelohania contejeani]|uniref:Eukaryotic translation initiation factor 2 subunit beta n=1 Tax=Astathelohania contejeani TaxID=164912 RepID=A0ABQ7HZ98_9MICR|nr:Eukaryotic translation initiation factor 2 subunit beta [Thelohania contejeani]